MEQEHVDCHERLRLEGTLQIKENEVLYISPRFTNSLFQYSLGLYYLIPKKFTQSMCLHVITYFPFIPFSLSLFFILYISSHSSSLMISFIFFSSVAHFIFFVLLFAILVSVIAIISALIYSLYFSISPHFFTHFLSLVISFLSTFSFSTYTFSSLQHFILIFISVITCL